MDKLVVNNIKVKVTTEDIQNGIARNSRLCPIANAVNRMFPGDCYVTVSSVSAHVNYADGDATERWGLPKEASNFVERFDLAMSVEPFEFEMYYDGYGIPRSSYD